MWTRRFIVDDAWFVAPVLITGSPTFLNLNLILEELRRAALWLAVCGFWFQNSQRNASAIISPLDVKN